ncbi:MAG: BA14K family protein [Methyloligellaceae bacterium]
MPKTILKGIAVAAALSVGALTLASPAEAGRGSRNLAVGALLGLGAAAIISGSHRRDHYYGYGYQPHYYAPPPVAYGAPPAYSYAPVPWTPAWYSYCSRRYRSFDPHSGTFQPYYGPRRLCR